MNSTHPPQQAVHARVLTGAGWLEGQFHLAKLHAFSEYLAHHGWYPLTDVVMAKVGLLPFLELSQRETLLVAVPPEAIPPPSPLERHDVSATLLLPGGSVDGTLALATSLRLSDFVQHTTGFIHVKKANVKVWADNAALYFEDLLVNPQRLVGVTEPETSK